MVVSRFAFVLWSVSAVVVRSGLVFESPLFSSHMILQRDATTHLWGTGVGAGPVKIIVSDATGVALATTSSTAASNGSWSASVGPIPASFNTTVCAITPESPPTCLFDVQFGDVLLCGGQSNMGYGMCGAKSGVQSPAQAMAALPPVRFFFNMGSGPGGGAPRSSCKGVAYYTPYQQWFTANSTNSGGASAVCMLTAAYLFKHFGGKVPIGAVESCVGGTNVAPWTPGGDGDAPGTLWTKYMQPLVPMSFRAALWDQGEADAKRTNSSWYAHEFPTMIRRWREAFKQQLPFAYVELCTEYGAEEPKESSFWHAMRQATLLQDVGYATTTDIQRALHPPDKQDVAARLVLVLRNIAYRDPSAVFSGPRLLSHSSAGSNVTMRFTNASLVSHAGILVGNQSQCAANAGKDGVVSISSGKQRPAPLAYHISGSDLVVHLEGAHGTLRVNSDATDCFLYSSETGLPAPPVSFEV